MYCVDGNPIESTMGLFFPLHSSVQHNTLILEPKDVYCSTLEESGLSRGAVLCTHEAAVLPVLGSSVGLQSLASVPSVKMTPESRTVSLVSRPVLLLGETTRVAREESWAVGRRGSPGTL